MERRKQIAFRLSFRRQITDFEILPHEGTIPLSGIFCKPLNDWAMDGCELSQSLPAHAPTSQAMSK
jgi:hypothetical protein